MSSRRVAELDEGDELAIADLPESEMNSDGKWEMVDTLTLGGEVDGKLITLELTKAEVKDVTDIDEVYNDE